MKASCLELRTKLEVEQCRLLAFAEVAGLLDWIEGQPLPALLRAQKLVVVAILTQIGCKLEDFSVMTNRYSDLRVDKDPQKAEQALKTNMKESLTTLEAKWQESVRKSTKRKEHLLGTNHLFKWVDVAKKIGTHPQSLWWAAFNEKKFREILAELTEFTDYLHELMHDLHAKESERINRMNYMELVLVRNDVADLRRLFRSLMMVNVHAKEERTPYASAANAKFAQLVGSLVDTKAKVMENDAADGSKPPSYIENEQNTKLTYSDVQLNEQPPNNMTGLQQRVRSTGVYTPDEKAVWLEWKTYQKRLDHATRGYVPLESNVRRVEELVALLRSHKLDAFRIPTCLGYIDYREDIRSGDSRHEAFFGLVFEFPEDAVPGDGQMSLLDLINTTKSEHWSLSQKIKLAHRIAESVLYLHAAQWLHKGIRSDGIVFFPSVETEKIELTEPLLAGFEYSRPDTTNTNSTHLPPDPHNDAYVHPLYQEEGTPEKGTQRIPFCKSFDIYSLGIVLLEIAYWTSIHTLLEKEFPPTTPEEANANADVENASGKTWDREEVLQVRQLLLSDTSTYLSKLKSTVGDRFHAAIETCIRGILDDPTKEAEHEVRLQKEFTEKVVDNLGAVQV